MKVKGHFSLKFVIFVPAVIASILLALTVKNYLDAVNRDIDDEYQRIETSLERATKVVTALDYSFSNYYKSGTGLLLEHNRKIEDGLCKMWPIDALLLAENKTLDIPSVDISYMLVGDKSLCQQESALYQNVTDHVSMAPLLSFLHDIDDFLSGVHYIDFDGFIMSSPDTLAKQITKPLLNSTLVRARGLFRKHDISKDNIVIYGPETLTNPAKKRLNISSPVVSQIDYEGLLTLQIDLARLLQSEVKLASDIHLINTSNSKPSGRAVREYVLGINGIVSSHMLYYELDLRAEIKNFFVFEKYSLIVTGSLYILLVTVLFYVNTRVERSYFRELAARDPMTGLLNRRGMEAFLRNTTHSEYLALSVLDIDNFKSINDAYGHDVGDDAICFMAEQIEKNIRDSDAVARFGGEEFVVYLRGRDVEKMRMTMERVREAISRYSANVVEGGFTVSGGVEIVRTEENSDFERLFKAADEKLYEAKNSGKNRLVF
ncbi:MULTISPECIES: GGDEF domain-containing protein [Vibrio]|uniref:GGDEF domain-containing protein n=1 Tax=Vibrio TaxID=662 RepID=UPI0001B95A58|nr:MULTISPECIES: GGDEF domain-containing protein [Vibrio]EEX33850.1 GGDEF family protein [Vibrio coralliilyticus ATCC BAA-450]MCM5510222.1 GGDEF domain-containing protein [Vibrio sp. SCSIO 43169]MDE3899135.1 GGDEF domain-containing protein [Vibrio sp. CC007]NRF61665.1 GGDEF domain-containing protein [Vibrio coralliilyticus]QFT35755.1 putative diguanylate cyclase AdrA [Vibrio sp. THAF64]